MFIIFLDIDGVLTTVNSEYDEQGIVFDPSAIAWLNKLFAKIDCKIVVSSAWRESYRLDELRRELRNLNVEIDSTTPVLSHRGIEIQTWLTENKHSNCYLVIDDNIKEIEQCIPKKNIIYVENGFEERGFSKIHYQMALDKIS
ncbi:HAD domain-containing protein [Candidatus Uabimicrobium sp. HlEnr_7]|uniref:HAD domain-containing protein n=1 Tax=Candidatus Uabimicrobium helgolandensis TaxID=3095367 RepID=UPI00355668A4